MGHHFGEVGRRSKLSLVTILFPWSIDNYMDYKALFVLDYTASYTETGVCLSK